MFNIGGQGQYFVGLIVANWVGVDRAPGCRRPPHIAARRRARRRSPGAVWAGIAGFLKATVGAHEVITTIMLNWIAVWFGHVLFGQGGPLQGAANKPLTSRSRATSPTAREAAGLLGRPGAAGPPRRVLRRDRARSSSSGLILNRTTLGYEVRAVGFNPDAAAYGGISVRKNYIRAMAISGAFAGLAGGLDMLGYLYQLRTLDIHGVVDRLPRASRSPCSAATPRSASGSARCSSAALLYGTTHGLDLERDRARSWPAT